MHGIEANEDTEVLAFMVPTLVNFSSAISQSGAGYRFVELECRCNLLASTYYLWLGRNSNDTEVSISADEYGMECLEKALNCLLNDSKQDAGIHINASHLSSSDRKGEHWSMITLDSLSKYRDDLQSSSIVSRARKEFIVIQQWAKNNADAAVGNFPDDHKTKLLSIGTELLERYTSDGKLEEAINDFILSHHHHLIRAGPEDHETKPGEPHWERLWSTVPSCKAACLRNIASPKPSRPSIIQVLSASLLTLDEKAPLLLTLFSRIASVACVQSQSLHRKGSLNDGRDMQTKEADDDAKCFERDCVFTAAASFFVDKMTDILSSYKRVDDMPDAVEGMVVGDCFECIVDAFICSSNESLPVKTRIAHSISRLVSTLYDYELSAGARRKIEGVYIVSLSKSIVCQRNEFGDLISCATDKRLKTWQASVSLEADYIALIANEAAGLMSLNPSTVNSDGSIAASHLVDAITSAAVNGTTNPSTDTSLLVHLSYSLLWFWKCMDNNAEKPESVARTRLLVPISSAIIALCGCYGVSVECTSSKTPDSDYFDTDMSVNGAFLSEEESGKRSKGVLLRKLYHLVQCISLVIGSVPEKTACEESSSLQGSTDKHGPFMPLVAVRILSSMSNDLFKLFGEDVWGKEYPYGARSCGATLDHALGSAYRCLYGFGLIDQPPNAYENPKTYAPESINAAAQIFRCIQRLYKNVRRSPPSKALEAVASALPPAEESPTKTAICQFLFDSNHPGLESNTTDLPTGFPAWVIDADKLDTDDNDVVLFIRKGICRELAKGPITHLDSSQSPSDMDDQGLSEERELTQSHELSLTKKFNAVLDDLCYSPNNIEGWIVLSECLGFKADIISDRLVTIKESYKSDDFCLTPTSMRESLATKSLEQLKQSQSEEFDQSRENWHPFIGDDLSVYMLHPWSSFASLQSCANEIGSKLSRESTDPPERSQSDYSCWKEIEKYSEEGDFVTWANSWAGMFVKALRTMKMRGATACFVFSNVLLSV